MIQIVLSQIKAEPDCSVLPLACLPHVKAEHVLPDDLLEFYRLCGGVRLFDSSDYPYRICSPDELVPANPVLIGEEWEGEISSSWYIVAWDGNGDALTIDLHPQRLGRCYDSFWDRHVIIGDSAIIALSFQELLTRLLEGRGEHPWWLHSDWVSYGDAYDELL